MFIGLLQHFHCQGIYGDTVLLIPLLSLYLLSHALSSQWGKKKVKISEKKGIKETAFTCREFGSAKHGAVKRCPHGLYVCKAPLNTSCYIYFLILGCYGNRCTSDAEGLRDLHTCTGLC